MTEKKTKTRKTKKPSETWTVRGVSHETREAVKRAARRSGLSMGAWMDEHLRLAATQKLTEAVPATTGGDDAMKEILARLEALESDRKTNVPMPFWRRWFGGQTS